MTTNANATERKPAYIAFKTFLTAVETFEQGIPLTIERSVWHTFSGGLQGHTINAFKFLGLIDEAGTPQPILEKVVNAKGDARKVIVKEIINNKYSEAIQLGQKNASFQRLQDHFRASGVQGEMVVRFFLDACAYTGEKCSPFWAKAKKTMRRSRKDDNGNTVNKTLVTPPPTPPLGHEKDKPNIQTIQLESGGTISLSVLVDLISLSSEDREFLFKMIDEFKEDLKKQQAQK